MARARNFAAPVIGHLAKALGFEHRLQEAQHFADKWLEQVPDDKDGHRLAALIACERVESPSR